MANRIMAADEVDEVVEQAFIVALAEEHGLGAEKVSPDVWAITHGTKTVDIKVLPTDGLNSINNAIRAAKATMGVGDTD